MTEATPPAEMPDATNCTGDAASCSQLCPTCLGRTMNQLMVKLTQVESRIGPIKSHAQRTTVLYVGDRARALAEIAGRVSTALDRAALDHYNAQHRMDAFGEEAEPIEA